MSYLLNNIEKETHPKVNFSTYMHPQTSSGGDNGPENPTEPHYPDVGSKDSNKVENTYVRGTY